MSPAFAVLLILILGAWGLLSLFRLLAVVNEGGDADTNGAVAGSLLGARYEYNAIPPKYIEGLKQKNALWRIIKIWMNI